MAAEAEAAREARAKVMMSTMSTMLLLLLMNRVMTRAPLAGDSSRG